MPEFGTMRLQNIAEKLRATFGVKVGVALSRLFTASAHSSARLRALYQHPIVQAVYSIGARG